MTTVKILRTRRQTKDALEQLRANDPPSLGGGEWRYEMRTTDPALRMYYIVVFDEEGYFLGYL